MRGLLVRRSARPHTHTPAITGEIPKVLPLIPLEIIDEELRSIKKPHSKPPPLFVKMCAGCISGAPPHLCKNYAKMFVCTTCEMKFRHPRYIEEHIYQSHPNTLQYYCTPCRVGCLDQPRFALHMKMHHNTKPIRTFKCRLCSFTGSPVLLTNHVLLCHPLK